MDGATTDQDGIDRSVAENTLWSLNLKIEHNLNEYIVLISYS